MLFGHSREARRRYNEARLPVVVDTLLRYQRCVGSNATLAVIPRYCITINIIGRCLFWRGQYNAGIIAARRCCRHTRIRHHVSQHVVGGRIIYVVWSSVGLRAINNTPPSLMPDLAEDD